MKLSEIIIGDAIVPSLTSKTRNDAIEELVESMAAAGAISKQKVKEITKAILAREEQATTGIGKGVALPHAKLKGIKKPMATIGCSADGIINRNPVKTVVMDFLKLSLGLTGCSG